MLKFILENKKTFWIFISQVKLSRLSIIISMFLMLCPALCFGYCVAQDILALSTGEVVINEVLYDPEGQDRGCFVELKGTPNLKLDGYFLVGVNGNSGEKYNKIDISGYVIPSDGYFVIAQDNQVPNADLIDSKADYQNGPDNIELWYEDVKIDAVGYGNFSNATFTGEGRPALDMSGYSIGRRPDGLDTNDNAIDFVGLSLPSPGEPNTPRLAVNLLGKLVAKWGFVKIINR